MVPQVRAPSLRALTWDNPASALTGSFRTPHFLNKRSISKEVLTKIPYAFFTFG